MAERKQAGFTPSEPAVYPPFLNIAIEGDQVRVLVRQAPLDAGVCGKDAAMRLPLDEFRKMLRDLGITA
jgi:hypothetical protein